MIIYIQTTEENFTLPTKGTRSFSISLKKRWFYVLEVTTWSGDEVINVSILHGEEVLFAALLEGEKLEYDMDPETGSINYPDLGDVIVKESGTYILVAQVIVEPTQGPTHLRLHGTNQRILGFDLKILFFPWLIAFFCSFFALIGSVFFELYQTIRTTSNTETHSRESNDM
ncbi:MAG: hypothetical protein ACFFCQ_12390 [Promethearchaeota archaeon]